MKNTAFILLLFTLVNCTKNDPNTENKFTLKKVSNPLNLSSYFGSDAPTLLHSEVPIGTIDKVVVSDNLIIVSDFYLMKSLKVFDSEGYLIRSRDDIGEGPMGMSEITDFDVFNGYIFVLDAHKRKIYTFDTNLDLVSEWNVPIACNNLTINHRGIFLLNQGLEATEARISRFDHQMNFIESILPAQEADTPIVVSNSSLFTKLNDSSFVFTHPFFPSIWYYSGSKMEKIDLDFGEKFINNSDLTEMDPLDRLHFVNNFEGYYQLSNGIKLNENELLYSIRHQKKNKYLKVSLATQSMELLENIKNDMSKSPSTITFVGNSKSAAWYWMDQADLHKFYSLNGHKIPDKDRIPLDQDKENKVVFKLNYR